jgi:hypothetical protein
MSTDTPKRRKQRRDELEQVSTILTTAQRIVRTRAFAAGVDDVRRGVPPRFDLQEVDHHWDYERGRQFGILAPKNLDPRGNLAACLLEAAFRRGWII